MIYCPSCGTANRDGSRFCNECGTKLPTVTSSLCPTCGTLNPPHSLFCEKCGTRLIASLADEPQEPEAAAPSPLVPKGLSLPTKSPAEPAEEGLPDWMQAVQSSEADTSELDLATDAVTGGAADQAVPEEVPDWLSDFGVADQSAITRKTPTDELLPEWVRRLRTTPEVTKPSAPEEGIPDWLKSLGATGQLPPTEETPAVSAPAAAEETPPWAAAHHGALTEPPAGEEEDLPEWLKEPPSPYFATAPSESAPPLSAPQAPPDAEEMPDWLRELRPAAGAEEALPDWLDELGVEEPPASKSTAVSTDDNALDWLSRLGSAAPEPPSDRGAAPAPETPAWLSGAGEEIQPTGPAVAPDWMSSLRAAAPEVDAQPAEEIPDWLRELEAEERPPETAAASEASDWTSSLRAAAIEPEAAAEEEDVPDWLKGAGLAAAGAAAVSSGEEAQPQEPAVSQKPITDWFSALRQATPEIEAEQAQSEDVPEWLSEESGAAPQAIGGPQAYDQEVPDWLHEAGAAAQPPPASTEPAEVQPPVQPEEEGVPDWSRELGAAAAGAAAAGALAHEQEPEEVSPQKPAADWLTALRRATPEIEAEQAAEEAEPEWLREESGAAPQAIGGPQAYDQDMPDWPRATGAAAQQPSASTEPAEVQPPVQPEEEDVPDWLKELGAAAAGAAAAGALAHEQEPEEVSPQKPATDWLTALRRATPEIEAEQAAEEAEPEWLREESGATPQAVGGPQAYDQDMPDWLREGSGTATGADQPTAPAQAEEDEGIPDWLKELGGVAVGAAAVAAVTPRAEEPTDEGLPGETPDWLRELVPGAVAAGAAVAVAQPEVEEPKEIEQPKETAEAEPEAESRVSQAAAVAVAGAAAVAVARAVKEPEAAEAAPAEMPEWLQEIRQEQETAKTAIPVPPPEATELTEAEIPAWMEALRPTDEAAVLKEAETPSETEGPLAGITNALPPAPVMGEMHGLPAKLQFAISAEDQARAGVLKELLTQHAVAPAAVEQFVVKGSAIRRRALRWIVAFLIIAVLLVPLGFDINQLTGLPLLPNVQTMVVPPAVSKAAFEISQVTQLPPNSKVLVVFDYDASQSGELNRVATALLRSPALRNAQIEVTSLNPQGSAVAQSVLTNLPDLQYADLGFVPGQVSGVQSVLAKAGDVKLIIEVAASPETVRWWAEQLKANRSAIPLVVGVSAGAEPLAMPYVQSGQVKGLISGFPGAVAYLNATGMMNTYSLDQIKDYQIPLDALALANYVMVALIVVGLIAALLRGAGRRSA